MKNDIARTYPIRPLHYILGNYGMLKCEGPYTYKLLVVK